MNHCLIDFNVFIRLLTIAYKYKYMAAFNYYLYEYILKNQ